MSMFATFYCCCLSPLWFSRAKTLSTYNLFIVVMVVVFPSSSIFLLDSILFLNSQVTLFDCINIDNISTFILSLRFALPHRGRLTKSRTRRETDKLELMRSQVLKDDKTRNVLKQPYFRPSLNWARGHPVQRTLMSKPCWQRISQSGTQMVDS